MDLADLRICGFARNPPQSHSFSAPCHEVHHGIPPRPDRPTFPSPDSRLDDWSIQFTHRTITVPIPPPIDRRSSVTRHDAQRSLATAITPGFTPIYRHINHFCLSQTICPAPGRGVNRESLVSLSDPHFITRRPSGSPTPAPFGPSAPLSCQLILLFRTQGPANRASPAPPAQRHPAGFIFPVAAFSSGPVVVCLLGTQHAI